jgi:hypothetical protein
LTNEKVPIDWAADVKRYVSDADVNVIAKIVMCCGIALGQSRPGGRGGTAVGRPDLVKPVDTSDEGSEFAGARRVEITVTSS